MKIVIDARLYGLENAGLGRYINNLVHKISKIDKKNQYVILLRKKYFKILNFPSNWKKVLADFRHYSFSEQVFLPFIISREKPDIVHFPHFNVPIFYRGKYVVTIHDLLMHTQKGMEATTLSFLAYFIKRLGYGLVFKTAVYKSIRVLVPSHSVKSELIKTYSIVPEKVSVIYEGLSNFNTTGPRVVREQYFIYSGNAYPHKNLVRLVRAILFLNKNSNRNVKLVIVSARNNFTHRLEKVVKNLNASKYVELLGFVSDSDLGSLLKNSIGFIFPSLSEGFGLPGLEAINAGTLLLASDIDVFKEVYKDCALYFNQLDFTSIEKVMNDALNFSQAKRSELIKIGQSFVKRYSWDKMAQETLELYEETSKNKTIGVNDDEKAS